MKWLLLGVVALTSCQRHTPIYPQGMSACKVEVPGAAGRCEPIGEKR